MSPPLSTVVMAKAPCVAAQCFQPQEARHPGSPAKFFGDIAVTLATLASGPSSAESLPPWPSSSSPCTDVPHWLRFAARSVLGSFDANSIKNFASSKSGISYPPVNASASNAEVFTSAYSKSRISYPPVNASASNADGFTCAPSISSPPVNASASNADVFTSAHSKSRISYPPVNASASNADVFTSAHSKSRISYPPVNASASNAYGFTCAPSISSPPVNASASNADVFTSAHSKSRISYPSVNASASNTDVFTSASSGVEVSHLPVERSPPPTYLDLYTLLPSEDQERLKSKYSALTEPPLPDSPNPHSTTSLSNVGLTTIILDKKKSQKRYFRIQGASEKQASSLYHLLRRNSVIEMQYGAGVPRDSWGLLVLKPEEAGKKEGKKAGKKYGKKASKDAGNNGIVQCNGKLGKRSVICKFGLTPETTEKLLREANLLNDLAKSNSQDGSRVLAPWIWGFREQVAIVVSPKWDGSDLKQGIDYISEKMNIRQWNETAAELLGKILPTVQRLHDEGVVLNGIKPHNILLEKSGDFTSVTMTGFDNATWLSATERKTAALCDGRPGYLPKKADPKADIFDLGILLAQMLLGKSCFNKIPDGLSSSERISWFQENVAHRSGIVAPRDRELSEEALDLLKQMLRDDPKTRPSAQQCLAHPFIRLRSHTFPRRTQGVFLPSSKKGIESLSDLAPAKR